MATGELAKSFLPGSPTYLLLKQIFIWSLPSARHSSRIPQTLRSPPPKGPLLSPTAISRHYTLLLELSQILFHTHTSINTTNLRPFKSQQTLLSNQWPLTAKISIPQPLHNPQSILIREPPSPGAFSTTFICSPSLSLQHPPPSTVSSSHPMVSTFQPSLIVRPLLGPIPPPAPFPLSVHPKS